MKRTFKLLLLPILLLPILFVRGAPVLAQNDCPPGTEWSRETVACEQVACPPEAGRTYTLECKCPEGTIEQYEELTDPATGNLYHLVAACALPSESGPSSEPPAVDCKSSVGACGEGDSGAAAVEEPGETVAEQGDGSNGGSPGEANQSSWWSRQRTGVKIALVAGGVAVLIGGAVAAGLITWAGVSALAGATAASLSTVTPFAAELVTAWATRKTVKVFVLRLARQSGKYLAKKTGHRATRAEVKQLMLQTINQELRKRGFAEWSATQFETLLQGIDLFW